MTAFAAAMDAIFQDANMAAEATWTPQGGVPLPVRVIRTAPDELTSFGAARILSDTTIIDVRVTCAHIARRENPVFLQQSWPSHAPPVEVQVEGTFAWVRGAIKSIVGKR